MERLTWKRSVDGIEDIGLRDGVTIGDAVCKLSDYEGTGLEPEEIIRLKSIESWVNVVEHELLKYIEAEKDGRLVVLPPNDPPDHGGAAGDGWGTGVGA